MTTEQESNNKAAFIRRASLCEFNKLWVCTHSENNGNKCTEICKNYNNPKENAFRSNP